MSSAVLKSEHTAPGSSSGTRFAKVAIVVVATALIAVSGILMVGPQIMVAIPLVLIVGMVFAIRRSFWSLLCFGYPLTFGLVSSWIGYMETPGYVGTTAFAVSSVVGLVGLGLVATGLWKVTR